MMRRLLCLCALVGIALPASSEVVQRVSVSTAGEQANGASIVLPFPCISADGHYVVFASCASNLVPDDTNGTPVAWDGWDVFVRDRATGTTERVSLAGSGQQANGNCGDAAAISAGGRYVVFASLATNLAPGDSSDFPDIFLRDRLLGTTEMVSVSTTGEHDPLAVSVWCTVSADGRYVAFGSDSAHLVPGLTQGGGPRVFLRDRLAGTTEVVSVSSAGVPATSWNQLHDMSPDGRLISFDSEDDGLVPGDTNGYLDGFIRDRLSGTTERVTVGATGQQGNDQSGGGRISDDGRYVVFGSAATNLWPEAPGEQGGLFVRDRWSGTVDRVVARSPADFQSPADGELGGISSDGRWVAFSDSHAGFVRDDVNGLEDVFLYDRDSDTIRLLSRSLDGTPVGGSVAAMTPDARCLVFWSYANTLVPGDTNGGDYSYNGGDVFVWDRDARFHDVPSVFWAFGDIEACVASGIVQGYPDNTYRPERTVTRDQMAVYIARSIASPTGDAGVPDGPTTATFEDVPNTGYGPSGTDPYWAYKYIEYCVSRGVVKGYDATHYGPLAVVNRGEMAVFIARAKGWVGLDDDMTTAPEVFPDVPAGYWCGTAIQACRDHGAAQGYEDGTYQPERQVDRGQMAVYIARAFGLPM